MPEFLLAFNFSTDSADGMNAQLTITGANSFLLDKGIQLQPLWPQLPVPPLNFVTLQGRSISIQTHDGGATQQQGVRVTLAVSANGDALTGNLPFSGGPAVSVSYQFVGYASQGSLSVGDFSIPFPNS